MTTGLESVYLFNSCGIHPTTAGEKRQKPQIPATEVHAEYTGGARSIPEPPLVKLCQVEVCGSIATSRATHFDLGRF